MPWAPPSNHPFASARKYARQLQPQNHKSDWNLGTQFWRVRWKQVKMSCVLAWSKYFWSILRWNLPYLSLETSSHVLYRVCLSWHDVLKAWCCCMVVIFMVSQRSTCVCVRCRCFLIVKSGTFSDGEYRLDAMLGSHASAPCHLHAHPYSPPFTPLYSRITVLTRDYYYWCWCMVVVGMCTSTSIVG